MEDFSRHCTDVEVSCLPACLAPAFSQGHENVVHYLLELGVKPTPDSTGSTPAYYARAKGFDSLAKVLGGGDEA